MAKELARYLEQQLDVIPKDHPDRGFLEREYQLVKARVSVPESIGDHYPEHTRLGRILYEEWFKDLPDSTSLRDIQYSERWYDMGFNVNEIAAISMVLRSLTNNDKHLSHKYLRTLGDARDAGKRGISLRIGIGNKGSAIMTEALRRPDSEETSRE